MAVPHIKIGKPNPRLARVVCAGTNPQTINRNTTALTAAFRQKIGLLFIPSCSNLNVASARKYTAILISKPTCQPSLKLITIVQQRKMLKSRSFGRPGFFLRNRTNLSRCDSEIRTQKAMSSDSPRQIIRILFTDYPLKVTKNYFHYNFCARKKQVMPS